MTTSLLKDTLIMQLEQLPHELQLRVLEYAKALSPKGVDGKNLLRFEGFIPEEELRRISQAIDNDCEKVDIHGW